MFTDTVVWVSVCLLICLFMAQRLGTDKVGSAFAPIICIWFAFIASIGIHNFIKYDPTIFRALNPQYIVDYFSRNKKDAWMSLGGIILAATGYSFVHIIYFVLLLSATVKSRLSLYMQMQDLKHCLLMLDISVFVPYV